MRKGSRSWSVDVPVGSTITRGRVSELKWTIVGGIMAPRTSVRHLGIDAVRTRFDTPALTPTRAWPRWARRGCGPLEELRVVAAEALADAHAGSGRAERVGPVLTDSPSSPGRPRPAARVRLWRSTGRALHHQQPDELKMPHPRAAPRSP